MDSIQIQIPSLSENIRIVESFIDNAKERFHLNDDIYGNIMIAVTESVNNAIVHGNQKASDKCVSLKLHVDDSTLKIVVSDEGPGFNYNTLPDPTAPENIEKPGGRGIFLMKHLCDEVHFEDEGRTVSMVFYLN
ncbi:ATP-binding protein [Marinoscillum pacificum]|uniref:ATP-binding protein n=1 Tax=Marinoscillum pacificum TaxID=392723 RepID=UPI00215813E3|nr:ATP-binding protein [Marinoscillum pacificum]